MLSYFDKNKRNISLILWISRENIKTHDLSLYLSTSLKSMFSTISNSSNGLTFSTVSNNDVLMVWSIATAFLTNDSLYSSFTKYI